MKNLKLKDLKLNNEMAMIYRLLDNCSLALAVATRLG